MGRVNVLAFVYAKECSSCHEIVNVQITLKYRVCKRAENVG